MEDEVSRYRNNLRDDKVGDGHGYDPGTLTIPGLVTTTVVHILHVITMGLAWPWLGLVRYGGFYIVYQTQRLSTKEVPE